MTRIPRKLIQMMSIIVTEYIWHLSLRFLLSKLFNNLVTNNYIVLLYFVMHLLQAGQCTSKLWKHFRTNFKINLPSNDKWTAKSNKSLLIWNSLYHFIACLHTKQFWHFYQCTCLRLDKTFFSFYRLLKSIYGNEWWHFLTWTKL